jgi:hypothetical protein
MSMDIQPNTAGTEVRTRSGFPWLGLVYGVLLLTPLVVVARLITVFMPRPVLLVVGAVMVLSIVLILAMSKRCRRAASFDWSRSKDRPWALIANFAAIMFFGQFFTGWAQKCFPFSVQMMIGAALILVVYVIDAIAKREAQRP